MVTHHPLNSSEKPFTGLRARTRDLMIYLLVVICVCIIHYILVKQLNKFKSSFLSNMNNKKKIQMDPDKFLLFLLFFSGNTTLATGILPIPALSTLFGL